MSIPEGVPSLPVALPRSEWQRDSDAPACSQCGHVFNAYWRRHHCRSCGQLFCGNCSAKKHDFAGDGRTRSQRLRVCDACKARLENPAGRESTAALTQKPGGDLVAELAAEIASELAADEVPANHLGAHATHPDIGTGAAGYGFGSRTSSAISHASLSLEPSTPTGLTRSPPRSGLSPVLNSPIRILKDTELENAIFFSYSRRHPGALNAVAVLVAGLRLRNKADGRPYCRACQEGKLIPWLDKEQMRESGGTDWSMVLARVQTKAILSVFCLSNAYCGSEECLKELQYADMKKFERIPVFLEGFINDPETFEREGLKNLCDADAQTFDKFEVAKDTVERLTFRLQGVPAFLDLSVLMCDKCSGTRDVVCPDCSDFDCVMGGPAGAKVDEMISSLGLYIDSIAVNSAVIPREPGQPEWEPLRSPVSVNGSPAAGTSPSQQPARHRLVHLVMQKAKVFFSEKHDALRLEDIQAGLKESKVEWVADKLLPIHISDASATECAIESQLRQGLVHCLLWCGKAEGWEGHTETNRCLSLCQIKEKLQQLQGVEPPRVAIVCLQYGAKRAAQALSQAGIAEVLWLTADCLNEKFNELVCEMLVPAIQMVLDGSVADLNDFLKSSLTSLNNDEPTFCPAPDNDNCGVIVQATNTSSLPRAPVADEQWLRCCPAKIIPAENLACQSKELKNLHLYACDLKRLDELRHDLYGTGKIRIISQESNGISRSRSIALTTCTSHMHESRYTRIYRISSFEQLQSLDSESRRGRVLLWLDLFNCEDQIEDMSELLREDWQDRRVEMILTCAESETADDFAEDLGFEELDIGSETGMVGVLADELHDEFKLYSEFSGSDSPYSLLDVYDPMELSDVLKAQLDDRPVAALYFADEPNAIMMRLCVSDVAFLHALRDKLLTGTFGLELASNLKLAGTVQKISSGELTVSVDRTHLAERYQSGILSLDKLTPHQSESLSQCSSIDGNIHIKAAAGTGKTFLALHFMLEHIRCELRNEAGGTKKALATVLFVGRNMPLVISVAKWLSQRAHGAGERRKILARVHLLFEPIEDGPHEVQWKRGNLEVRPAKRRQPYKLMIVDEAHHVYVDSKVRAEIENFDFDKLVLLSDISQSVTNDVVFPTGLAEIKLLEVVRSSKRVVTGAMQFQLQGDNEGLMTTCHHEAEGPPLKSYLFDVEVEANKFEQYAEHTAKAVRFVMDTFPGLHLHNRVAIIVPDRDFRDKLEGPLARSVELMSRKGGRSFQLMDAATTSSACPQSSSAKKRVGEPEWLTFDPIHQMDGLEWLFVIGVGLDTSIDSRDSDILGTRSMLYRAITRAHMMVVAVNEYLPEGWFGFLARVRLSEEDFNDVKLEREKTADVIIEDTFKQQQQLEEQAKQALQQETQVCRDLGAEGRAFAIEHVVRALMKGKNERQAVYEGFEKWTQHWQQRVAARVIEDSGASDDELQKPAVVASLQATAVEQLARNEAAEDAEKRRLTEEKWRQEKRRNAEEETIKLQRQQEDRAEQQATKRAMSMLQYYTLGGVEPLFALEYSSEPESLEDVYEHMLNIGFHPSWCDVLVDGLEITTPLQLRAITALDLRLMGARTGVNLDDDQIQYALKLAAKSASEAVRSPNKDEPFTQKSFKEYCMQMRDTALRTKRREESRLAHDKQRSADFSLTQCYTGDPLEPDLVLDYAFDGGSLHDFMEARGFGSLWIKLITQFLKIETPVQLMLMSETELRSLQHLAGLELDTAAINQVLQAIHSQDASNDISSELVNFHTRKKEVSMRAELLRERDLMAAHRRAEIAREKNVKAQLRADEFCMVQYYAHGLEPDLLLDFSSGADPSLQTFRERKALALKEKERIRQQTEEDNKRAVLQLTREDTFAAVVVVALAEWHDYGHALQAKATTQASVFGPYSQFTASDRTRLQLSVAKAMRKYQPRSEDEREAIVQAEVNEAWAGFRADTSTDALIKVMRKYIDTDTRNSLRSLILASIARDEQPDALQRTSSTVARDVLRDYKAVEKAIEEEAIRRNAPVDDSWVRFTDVANLRAGRMAGASIQEIVHAAADEWQLRQNLAREVSIRIRGHPRKACNSVYYPTDIHKGYPHFQSAEGKHLYFCEEQQWWVLNDRLLQTMPVQLSVQKFLESVGLGDWGSSTWYDMFAEHLPNYVQSVEALREITADNLRQLIQVADIRASISGEELVETLLSMLQRKPKSTKDNQNMPGTLAPENREPSIASFYDGRPRAPGELDVDLLQQYAFLPAAIGWVSQSEIVKAGKHVWTCHDGTTGWAKYQLDFMLARGEGTASKQLNSTEMRHWEQAVRRQKRDWDRQQEHQEKQQHFEEQSVWDPSSNTTRGVIRAERSAAQPWYRCSDCDHPVAEEEQMTGPGTMGRGEDAYFFSGLRDWAKRGEERDMRLSTSLYVLQDVDCPCCHQDLGWQYVQAENPEYRHRAGTFCIYQRTLKFDGDDDAGNSSASTG